MIRIMKRLRVGGRCSVIADFFRGSAEVSAPAVKVATSVALDWIEGAVAKGLSANLCDAIAQMGSDEGDRETRIAISWAAARQLPAEVPSSFLFAPDTLDYVKSTGI